MHRGTAARYLKANAGPEELKQERGPRTYRTRSDPLKDIMPEAAPYLESWRPHGDSNPGFLRGPT